jgi:hypothetical protein
MNYDKTEIIKNITKEYKEMILEGNYMKSLKKMYSIIKLQDPDDPRLNILLNFFNSPVGLAYRCKSDLETLDLALEYDKFTIEDIYNSLQLLKELISSFPITNNLESISKIKNKMKMRPELIKQIKYIKTYVNNQAKKFINQTNL